MIDTHWNFFDHASYRNNMYSIRKSQHKTSTQRGRNFTLSHATAKWSKMCSNMIIVPRVRKYCIYEVFCSRTGVLLTRSVEPQIIRHRCSPICHHARFIILRNNNGMQRLSLIRVLLLYANAL